MTGKVIQIFWIPFIIFAVIASRKHWKTNFETQSIYEIVVCTFLASIFLHCYLVHYEPRYFLYAVTPSVVLCFCILWERFRIGLIVVLCITVAIIPLKTSYQRHLDVTLSPSRTPARSKIITLEELKKHFSQDEVVFTQSPAEFTFHTRIKSVVMPFVDDPNVVKNIAQQYGIKKIVIWAECSHLYRDLAEGKSTDWATCIEVNEHFVIARLK